MKNCPTLCPFFLHLPADTRQAVAPPPPARGRGAVMPPSPRAAPRRLSEKARVGRCITLIFAITLLAILALVIADLQTPAEARQGATAAAPNHAARTAGPSDASIGGLRVVVQKGHNNLVDALAVSPDGKIFVSGGDDKTIKIWDVETGLLLRTIETGEWVYTLAITPDGKTIVSGGDSYTVRFYGMGDGALKRTLSGHTSGVAAVKLTPKGDALVSVGADRTVRAWPVDASGLGVDQPKGGRVVARDFTGSVNAVTISPDGARMAIGADGDSPLRVYSVAASGAPQLLAGHEGGVNAVAYSPTGAALASVGEDKIVRVWDAKTNVLLNAMRLNKTAMAEKGNPLKDVKWSPDGTRLVALARLGNVYIWETAPATGKPVRVVKAFLAQELGGTTIAFLPSGREFATTGGFDGEVRLWDAATFGRVRTMTSKQGPANRYYYAGKGPAARLISYVIEKGEIRRNDVLTGAALPAIKTGGETDEAEAVAFSPSGKLMAYTISLSANSEIHIVDTATGKDVAVMPGDKKSLTSLSFSPDENRIVGAGKVDNNLVAWDINTAKSALNLLRLSLDMEPLAVSWSPDGKYLAVSNHKTIRLELWDVATGKKVRTFSPPPGEVEDGAEIADFFAWSPDSAQLVSANIFGDLATWNVATGKEIRRIYAHKGWLLSLAVSPDGKFIASGGVDRVLKFWGLADGKQRAMRFAVTDTDWAVVTPEGRFDGTEQGVKQIHYVRANRPIPLESFFERFFTPHLLAQVLTGAKPVLPTPAPVADIKLPPRVEIVSPKPGAQSVLADVTVNVEVTDQGGGIAETLLYQNGKLVNRDTRALVKVDNKTGAFTKTFAVTLLPGVNVLRATAFNRDRTESAPSEVIVNLAGSAAEVADADLYIVAVGINGYTNPKYRLTYATPDAQAFTEAVEASGKNIFRHIVKTEVFDENATRANIEAALAKVAKTARPQDAFVLYYSGHGVMSEGEAATGTAIAQPAEFFLACADLTQFTSDDDLKAKGVSATRMRDLCLSVKAQKQLIILDACQSGGAVDVFATRGVPEEKAIAQLARSAGVMVLSAALSQQVATELTELKHGVFTYALMQGLRGEADGGKNPDGKITVGELKTFVSDRVPELSKKYQSQAQYPSGFSRGQDFPLGVTGK